MAIWVLAALPRCVFVLTNPNWSYAPFSPTITGSAG
jgi:hypothetical protein